MTIQLTIIGLGQVGTSIGLKLADHSGQIKRVGHDRERGVMQKVKSLGAFDDVQFNLFAAIEGADVILLCLPLDQIEETLKLIGPDLRENVVVMDTAPVKAPVAEWFKTYIPAGRYYIGLLPALNPDYLEESGRGYETARADLFERGTMGIVTLPGAPEAVVNLATNFAHMLGAHPLFLDLLEADGMMANVHLLPQLTAAALLNATAGQPGWQESRRLAGRPYALASTSIFEDELAALFSAATFNRQNTLHALDMLIGALTNMRKSLETADDKDLNLRLECATKDRLGWWQERHSADWARQEQTSAGTLTFANYMQRLFMGSAFDKKKK